MADPARGPVQGGLRGRPCPIGRQDGGPGPVHLGWTTISPSPAATFRAFPRRFGAISITKAVEVGRGGPKLENGAHFTGHVASLGARLAHGTVTLDAPAEAGFIPKALRLPVWHTRYMPDLAGGDPLVYDLARNIVSDFAVANVWIGHAGLELFESEFEELAALRPIDVVGGFPLFGRFLHHGR